MDTKEFFRSSTEHAGIEQGSKFKLIKLHHEVKGDLSEGVEKGGLIEYPLFICGTNGYGSGWTYFNKNDKRWYHCLGVQVQGRRGGGGATRRRAARG